VTDLFVERDGRTIGYAECGDPTGTPLVHMHGAPGSRLDASPTSPFAAALAGLGIRLIGVERPGYGISSSWPGRRIVDVVGDVEAVTDHLGLDRFVVAGHSSGGPHALAVGARLPDRVTAIIAIASIAPLARTRDFTGCGEAGLLELALRDPEGLRAQMRGLAAAMRTDPTATLIEMLGSVLSERDIEVSLQPEFAAYIEPAFIESARGDYAGYAEDCIAEVADWGFDLSTVSPPVHLLHGTADLVVPIEHSRTLAQELPNALLTEHAGDGHISVLTHFVELDAGLVAR
jgi:pimeloyl-ACP methyl ester carboxylesterase